MYRDPNIVKRRIASNQTEQLRGLISIISQRLNQPQQQMPILLEVFYFSFKRESPPSIRLVVDFAV